MTNDTVDLLEKLLKLAIENKIAVSSLRSRREKEYNDLLFCGSEDKLYSILAHPQEVQLDISFKVKSKAYEELINL